MSAGLPGLGLGGLFFIISALLAPFVELARTLRGRSNPDAWRAVWRQFAIAVVMVVAIELTLRGLFAAARLVGLSEDGGGSINAVPVAAVGITTSLLVLTVGGAKLAQLVCRPARRAKPGSKFKVGRPAEATGE